MLTLELMGTSEIYEDLDAAMKDCMEVFPDAEFSLWNDNQTTEWIDVFSSRTDRTIVGRILKKD